MTSPDSGETTLSIAGAPGALATTRVTRVAAPAKWMVLLHGIYGRGRNWASVAKRFTEFRPDWGVVLTDLRHHGDSPNLQGPHTLDACALDVVRTFSDWPHGVSALVGHSFGGKVALLAAERLPVTSVWLMDSTPQAREPAGTAWDMLDVIDRLPRQFGSRSQLVGALVGHGFAEGVASWMATNLVADGAGFRWRLDFAVMRELLGNFFATDLWRLVEEPRPTLETHVVKAQESSTLDEAACERLARVQARLNRGGFHPIAGGHWVNVENPAAVVELWQRHVA